MFKNRKFFISLFVAGVMVVSLFTTVRANTIEGKTTDSDKTWNILFNGEIELDEETKKSITVKDSNGSLINVKINLKDNKTIAVSPLQQGYKKGEIYTLNIGDKVHSKDLKYLKTPRNFKFKIVEKTDSSNKIDYKYKDLVNKSILNVMDIIEKKGIETHWEALAMMKSGKSIPKYYTEKLENDFIKNKGVLKQPTDYEKLVLYTVLIGKEPRNFGGYNLLEKIYNNEDIESQGINAYIFGLIAFDSKDFKIPDNALWTREKLIDSILENRTEDNGWDFAGIKADPDMTGMAIAALAPHNDNPKVKEAIDKAIEKLSMIQNKTATFVSYDIENCESVCQVIMGLCANGIDPTDQRFVKNNKTLIDALFIFKTSDGGFSHTLNGKKNSKATEQAVQALLAYKSLKETGKGSLYIK
ncbi:hypothetical protein [Clostridium rectalis]|uniref:hypothetical protein n=1 Tax=Clostridium rectalis TaxID=2040295 RepID=UPI000F6331F9|nr:hypothetical protein [Clostridium rectalis]